MAYQLSQGFILGLAMGVTCISTCGPIYSIYLSQTHNGLSNNLIRVLKITLGRFASYAIFGLFAGLFGSKLVFSNRNSVIAISYIFLSLLLVISSFLSHKKEKGCDLHRLFRYFDSPFLLGLMMGINICPPFLLALLKAFELSGALSGIIFFVFFFIGTSIYMLPLAIFGVINNKNIIRIIGRIAAIGIGSWYLFKGINILLH